MEQFKRNQLEQAISGLFERNASAPSDELRTKLRRLLDTDRNLGRRPRSNDPEKANYAFFSSDAPGSGVEVWFSAYEAFALYIAFQLLELRWPQASAVSILRLARTTLEPRHATMLALDPEEIFDEKKIRATWRAGSIPLQTTHPVFLVVASRQGYPADSEQHARTVHVFDEKELSAFIQREPPGLFYTYFELVRAAHAFHGSLKSTNPSKRGRASA